MKIVLKRTLVLGDLMYKPEPAGVEIPEMISGKKVILYKEDYEPQEDEIMLPKEAREATDKDIDAAPNPAINYPSSEQTVQPHKESGEQKPGEPSADSPVAPSDYRPQTAGGAALKSSGKGASERK